MALWIGAIVLLAIMVLAVLVVFGRQRSNPEEAVGAEIDAELETEIAALPMSPLQKRAWWGLGIGLVLLTAIVALFVDRYSVGYWREGRHA